MQQLTLCLSFHHRAGGISQVTAHCVLTKETPVHTLQSQLHLAAWWELLTVVKHPPKCLLPREGQRGRTWAKRQQQKQAGSTERYEKKFGGVNDEQGRICWFRGRPGATSAAIWIIHVLAATLHGKGKKSGGSPAAPSDLTAHLPLRQQCEEQCSWLPRFQRRKGLRWISGCF